MLNSSWGHLRDEMAPILKPLPVSVLITFISFLFFGILLRFLNIDFHGIWRDEIATLFFSSHLSEVFTGDSHSLFYYLFMSPVGYLSDFDLVWMRYFEGGVSLLLYFIIVYRSRLIFNSQEWFVFNSIYGLHPAVIGLARLARPYTLLLDLTTLLIIERKVGNKKLIYFYAFLLISFYPLAIIPLFFEWFFSSQRKEMIKGFVLVSLPTFLYYGFKLIFDQKKFSYIGWINSNWKFFLEDINSLLLGNHFPYYQGKDLLFANYFALEIIVGLMVVCFFAREKKKTRSLIEFIVVYGGVLIGINLFSYLIDLRVQRYYVFLIPYFLIALATILSFKNKIPYILGGILGGVCILQMTFLHPYFTPRHSLGSSLRDVELLSKGNGNAPVYACGYDFHNWYFKRLGFLVCNNPADQKRALEHEGTLVYAYLDKQLSILPLVMNNRSVEVIPVAYDFKLMLLSPKEKK